MFEFFQNCNSLVKIVKKGKKFAEAKISLWKSRLFCVQLKLKISRLYSTGIDSRLNIRKFCQVTQ